MACSTRVRNLTTGKILKRNQAIGRIEQCVSVWVDKGFSIRDLTLPEMVVARSEQVRMREPIAFSELPGIVYRPTERNQAGNREELRLMREANSFAQLATEGHSATENQNA